MSPPQIIILAIEKTIIFCGFAYVSAGVAAVSRLAIVAVASQDSNVAKELAKNWNKRVTAGNLAIVVTVDAASGRRRSVVASTTTSANVDISRGGNGNGSQGKNSGHELHDELIVQKGLGVEFLKC